MTGERRTVSRAAAGCPRGLVSLWLGLALVSVPLLGCSRGGKLDQDGDGFGAGVDCDDTDAARHPAAAETCNGVDDNCNGEIDEDVDDMPVWFEDRDGDGRGDPDLVWEACAAPPGWVEDNTDCDDASRVSHPQARELCDGRDNDCDGEIDEGLPPNALAWYEDADGDGFGSSSLVARACEPPGERVSVRKGDCDDGDAAVHPRAEEDHDDGVDNNCDGWVDLEGRYAGRLGYLYGRAREAAGDYECAVYWDTVGEVSLDPADLCDDCAFTFDLIATLDSASSYFGGCGVIREPWPLRLSFGAEPTAYGTPVYYEYAYGYGYGYGGTVEVWTDWLLWGYAEVDGTSVHYDDLGYVDRVGSTGRYSSELFYGVGELY